MCNSGPITWKREIVPDHKVQQINSQSHKPSNTPISLTLSTPESSQTMAAACVPSQLWQIRQMHALISPHRYMWLYVLVLKDFLVYVSDIFTAITMLTTKSWSNQIFNSCPKTIDGGCIAVPFKVGKWLFVGCIIFSFLLVRSPVITTRYIHLTILSAGIRRPQG